ncbi:MAG TPA: hypothetical protein VFE78_27955 [Gemmataceae bacterium]|nr:hypothetical protein [Gemmataceae bacterium]
MKRRWPVYLLFGAVGGALGGLASCGRPTAGLPTAEALAPGAVRAQAADEPAPAEEKAPPPAPEGFRFPDDAGGALLAKVLPPTQAGGPAADRARGPRRSTRQKFDAPALPLPSSVPDLPRLPASKRQPLRPRLTLEESLDDVAVRTPLPQPPTLPAGERVRVASPDANAPVPLPVLARPASDRAPVEDVTGEASAAAAVAAPMPQRTTPAPFLKLTVPDPYEHRRPLGVPAPPERAAPVAGSPTAPKK